MTDNIIQFPGKDQWAPNPKRLVEFLVEQGDNLDSLIIFGLTKEGDEVSAYACSDVANAVFHMRLAEFRLLRIFEGAHE